MAPEKLQVAGSEVCTLFSPVPIALLLFQLGFQASETHSDDLNILKGH